MIALLAALLLLACSSFTAVHAFQSITPSSRSVQTALEGRKIKRQLLGTILEDGVISTPKRVKKASKRSNASTSGVSSDLASWAAASSNDDDDDASTTAAAAVVDDDATMTPAFVTFEKESPRRVRQTERLQIDKKQLKATKKLTDQLDAILEEGKNNLPDILSAIQTLISAQPQGMSSFQTLVSSKQQQQNTYRLAWVGSDDAICHIGTGQHKVPLARLQEVFLILQGKSRLELYEVISLFGPFPNVRNTLQGSCSVAVNDNTNTDSSAAPTTAAWKITWESMIDGTGKELLDNSSDTTKQQLVDLQVCFGDSNAILAIVPPPEGEIRTNPLEANGAHVLLFIREDDLDGKLDALRVI